LDENFLPLHIRAETTGCAIGYEVVGEIAEIEIFLDMEFKILVIVLPMKRISNF